MSRVTQAFVLVMLGAVLVKLAATGEYENYVRTGLGPYLAASGFTFFALGVTGLIRDLRTGPKSPNPTPSNTTPASATSSGACPSASVASDPARRRTHGPGSSPPQRHSHGNGHGHGHGVGWLVCVPLFLLLVMPPPALGAYAAGRADAAVPKPPIGTTFGPLPATVTLRDYAARAVWDEGRTLTGRRLTLTGFVAASASDQWYLSRLHITCCAADATATKIRIDGSTRRYPTNQWLTVTGTWTPATADHIAVLHADVITATQAPANPYE